MTLSIAKTSFELPPNSHFGVYDSIDTPESSTWDISNLVAGDLHQLPGSLGNQSGAWYNAHTRRLGTIQNAAGVIREWDEDEVIAGTVLAPIRTISTSGWVSADTESLTDPQPNFLEGGYSSYTSDEGGGANNAYRMEFTRAELVSTSNITKGVRSRRTDGPAGPGNNDGKEGVDRNHFTETMVTVMEGRQEVVDPPHAFEWEEPADRDADATYADNSLVVTTPYVADDLLAPTHDQSDILWHLPTDTFLVLSDLGNRIYHIQRGSPGTVLGEFDLSGLGLGQIEWFVRYGDGLIVGGETGFYRVLEYIV